MQIDSRLCSRRNKVHGVLESFRHVSLIIRQLRVKVPPVKTSKENILYFMFYYMLINYMIAFCEHRTVHDVYVL